MATEEFSGPIDYAVFVAPHDADIGAALQVILERVASGTLELLDLEVVGRGADGSAERRTLAAFPKHSEQDLAVFEGAESRLLDDEDLAAIAESLGDGELAIVVVYEDRSLAAVASALAAQGGAALWSGGITIEELAAAVDEDPEEN